MVALAPCVILSSIRRDELEVWHSAGIVKQAVDGNIHSEQRGRLADVGQHLPLSSMGQALRKQESTWRLLRCARNNTFRVIARSPEPFGFAQDKLVEGRRSNLRLRGTGTSVHLPLSSPSRERGSHRLYLRSLFGKLRSRAFTTMNPAVTLPNR
jgi:hypothetical protein